MASQNGEPTHEGTRQVDQDESATLLARCQKGDQHAWERLVGRYERLVFSIPLNYGLGRDAACDIMQSTFTELLASLDRVREPDRLGAWLATVARRQTWRAIEDQQRQDAARAAGRREIDLDGGLWHDFIDRWNDRNWVVEAVLALDGPCRELLEALYLDPTAPSYDEVAERLGRPRGSLGPQRGRCLDKLRRQMHLMDEHV